MKEEERCENCRHWDRDVPAYRRYWRDDDGGITYGECRLIRPGHWQEHSTAFLSHGALMTDHLFGCIQWQGRGGD